MRRSTGGPRRSAGARASSPLSSRIAVLAGIGIIGMIAAARPDAALARQSASRQSASRQAGIDRGIGIVSFDRSPGADTRSGEQAGVPGDSIGADTLLLRRDTTGGPVVARYIHRTNGASWSYTVETREPVQRTSLEFEYEVEGLPVDVASADARWVRAIYGIAEDGSARRAWIRLVPGLTRFERWTTILGGRPLFFDEGIAPEFFGAPGGPAVSFPVVRLPDGTPDYVMHPLEIRAEAGWMRVRVSTPSDVCGGPDSVRQAMLWVRYLTDAGRPRVWYHTRGC